MSNKVIITGGAGFIGGHLIDRLLIGEEYNKLICIDTKFYSSQSTKKSKISYWDSIINDLKNIQGIEVMLNDAKTIFHLAGISGIQDCLLLPIDAFHSNVISTLNILESIKGNKEVLFVFSSSVYVNNDVSGIYGITKRTCEDLIKYYHDNFGLNYLIFRVGTVYGTRANHYNSMTNLIKKALTTKKISYYGSGEEVREYIHVKDVAEALVKLSCDKNYWNDTYEITGINPMKAKDMVTTIKDLLGAEYKIEFRNEKVMNHYNVTPYKYRQETVKKYIPDTCISFGSGLLEVIKELDNEKEIIL